MDTTTTFEIKTRKSFRPDLSGFDVYRLRVLVQTSFGPVGIGQSLRYHSHSPTPRTRGTSVTLRHPNGSMFVTDSTNVVHQDDLRREIRAEVLRRWPEVEFHQIGLCGPGWEEAEPFYRDLLATHGV